MTATQNISKDPEIGVVFTPVKWAKFAIKEFNLFDKWMSGMTIFDPTMGEGNLFEALIATGYEKRINSSELPVENLFGVELHAEFIKKFFRNIKERYELSLPAGNFLNKDIFFLNDERKYDIVFGNPPWQNFVDLPGDYKVKIKPLFYQYDLIGNPQDLLLGGSRIDIAALVIQKVIEKNLKIDGESVFFMPLSLLLNDGANKQFRTYKINDIYYCIDKVFDFNDNFIFDDILTRYGLVHFKSNKKQKFPIPYLRWENNNWKKYHARPLMNETDPLSILKDSEYNPLKNFNPIVIGKKSMPRQGINTCGANETFFFDYYETMDEYHCCLTPSRTVILPEKYVYPLLTAKNFKEDNPVPGKWVVLPYNTNGRPLTVSQLVKEEKLMAFLMMHKNHLLTRKGIMINTWIKRDIWWALFGVGEYNFYPYKIVWESYGKKEFIPKIFPGYWQANQSLQAYIPVHSLPEANQVLHSLQDKKIEEYLLSLKMEGTMNWAQPGKIKKLIAFRDDPGLFYTYAEGGFG
ncbi:MAG: SAM-dependent DNA methyltransferase [Bacteroidetes bacterium]|nr:SAM-dependent DNA methyltransferase [Bacteroidota bacterium]